jgi:hypothetical protein
MDAQQSQLLKLTSKWQKKMPERKPRSNGAILGALLSFMSNYKRVQVKERQYL